MIDSLIELFLETGFCYVDWRMIVMWMVVLVLFYLAVYKEFEPLLLVPIAFGALLANLPTEGVVNKPAGALVSPAEAVVRSVFVERGDSVFVPRVVKHIPKTVGEIVSPETLSTPSAQGEIAGYFAFVDDITSPESRKDVFKKAKGIPDLIAIVSPAKSDSAAAETFSVDFRGRKLSVSPDDILVWASASGDVTEVSAKAGDRLALGAQIVDVYSARTGGLYHYLQLGVLLEIFPPLIFLGVGALTDFGPLIANPKTLILGGAAQFGVFATFIVAITCILLVPDVSALVGMLMLGNFIRECGVCERLSKAAQNELINVTTIFLGTSVGITMTGDRFIRVETLSILALGVVAFGFSTAAGVVMAKVMNLFLKDKINPLIGSAGVSAVPMAARVSQIEGQKADPSNFLLMHAMGPNVAGVIGTALVAGYFISTLTAK